jgi:hypothetical protein
MSRPDAGAGSARLWFRVLVAVSVILVVITMASYAFIDHRRLALFLFWLGLGGENNVGAWWSGMLLALAAFFAFDGFFDPAKGPAEQRGWLALGFALLLLSFDEVASLHEYLSLFGVKYLAVLGVVGLTLASYGIEQLHRARLGLRVIFPLLIAFALLASVPLQELLQHKLQWDSQVIYGLRAMLEEGTEIIAMLIFVSVAGANCASLLRSSQNMFGALVHRRWIVPSIALLLWPVFVAATFELPRPGGPADWLASTLFLASALLAVRAGVLGGRFDTRAVVLILFYVTASAAANAVQFRWDPTVFGTVVNVRGAVFALLVIIAIAVLRANGRRLPAPRALMIAAIIGASALVWPSLQILWCGLPPALAIWLYGIESKEAEAGRKTPVTTASLSAEPSASSLI